MEQFLNGILIIVFFMTFTFFILFFQWTILSNRNAKKKEPVISSLGLNADQISASNVGLESESNSTFNSFFNINYTNPPEMNLVFDSNNANIIPSKQIISPNSNIIQDIYIDDSDYTVYSDLVHQANLKKSSSSNQKCCFLNKFRCDRKGNCFSGVEKRCGVYANLLCSETTHLCNILDKSACGNSANCDFNDETNECVKKVNPHDGFEISCSNYERFKKQGDFENMLEYNCEEKLLFI